MLGVREEVGSESVGSKVNRPQVVLINRRVAEHGDGGELPLPVSTTDSFPYDHAVGLGEVH